MASDVTTDTNLMSTEIRKIFQMQSDELMATERNILVSHFGSFSQELVSSLSEGVEDLLVSIGDRRIVIKRMFSILIEGLQNIRVHGSPDDLNRQLGYVILSSSIENYMVTMANIVTVEEQQKIEGFINKINDYSDEGLKDTYMSVLSNDFLSKKGGAGLGFITTRMKSGNPLNYHFFELSEEKALFSLEVCLAR